MEKIIYRTKLYTKANIISGILLGLVLIFLLGKAVYDDISNINEWYLVLLLVFLGVYLLLAHLLKIFTLTESEFIVESPIAVVVKPKRIPIKDIQKLVFNEAPGAKSNPFLQIYLESTGKSTNYKFAIVADDIQRLIDELRTKGIQVECVGIEHPWK